MHLSRSQALRDLETTPFDLCIVGGGATGAGCALDAQLRGLRTALVEAADFASHTSSASTKMAHGGIRYLQLAARRFDFRQYRLVRHALRERAVMLRNAPHLARPLEFLAPCFSLPELSYYGLGLKLYDRVAGRDRLAPSHILPAGEALRRLPRLRPENLRGAVSYADGQFDDARYALALVTTFVEAGGCALNYAYVTGFERAPGGQIAAAAVEDRISGGVFPIRARAFVNATGPFSDRLRRLASPAAPPRLRPSKGVHILFPLDHWGSDSLLVPKTEDGRVVFAIPYHGRLLVGTTEDPASPDAEMLVTRSEIDYLLRQINPYLNRPLAAADVVSGFAGLRPLVSSRSAGNTSRLIRDDEVEVDASSGLVSILGGKWTTYRLMAERTIDRVQSILGIPVGDCVTASKPLAGAEPLTDAQVRALTERFGFDTARRLARRYGSRARALARLAEESADLSRPLIAGAPPLRAEVVYAARHEMARTVEDVLARRTALQLYDWRLAIQAAPEAARLMAPELNWSPEEIASAAETYIQTTTRLLQAATQNSELKTDNSKLTTEN